MVCEKRRSPDLAESIINRTTAPVFSPRAVWTNRKTLQRWNGCNRDVNMKLNIICFLHPGRFLMESQEITAMVAKQKWLIAD